MSDYGTFPNLNERGEGLPEYAERDIRQGAGDERVETGDTPDLTSGDPIDAEASVLFDTERRKDLGFYEDV